MAQPQMAAEENAYRITAELAGQVRKAVQDRDQDRLVGLLDPLHVADIADLLEQVGPELRRDAVSLLGEHLDSEVISEVDESLQEELLAQLPPQQLEEVVRDLDSDDVVDLVEDLGTEQQQAVLNALDEVDRAVVEHSLQYPEDSAGRLMQREIVMVPSHWDVGTAIDHMRSETGLPEQFYHLFLTDPRADFVGMASLGRVMSSRRETRLLDIVDEDCHPVPPTMPEEEVAYAFNQYHLISAPVVNEHGRLVGVITIDDAMNVLDEEAEEDLLRLAGVGSESLYDRVFDTASQRFPWLIVNLATAIAASVVIDQFSEAIGMMVALAVLMPIVASMGGNAGTQSLTVAVRALATKDLTASNAWRIIRRESMVGLINGLVFAAIVGAVGGFWFSSAALGSVLALAMIITMVAAALSGILIPIGLERARVDPALASGVFVTTVTDVVGFFAFLGIAAALLF